MVILIDQLQKNLATLLNSLGQDLLNSIEESGDEFSLGYKSEKIDTILTVALSRSDSIVTAQVSAYESRRMSSKLQFIESINIKLSPTQKSGEIAEIVQDAIHSAEAEFLNNIVNAKEPITFSTADGHQVEVVFEPGLAHVEPHVFID